MAKATQQERAAKIQQLLEIVQDHRNKGRGDLADSIQELIGEIQGGQRDANDIKIKARVALKKFDGPKVKGDGKSPIEIQEFLTEG